MKRGLAYFNLAGVLALAVLCVLQWRANSRLHFALFDSEKNLLAREEKISSLEQTGRGLTNDLAQFKQHIVAEHEIGQQRLDAAQGLQQTNAALLAQRDELMASVTNWSRAVRERDDSIQQANERIRALSSELNASIVKFNNLTTNFNHVVQELNEARTNSAPASH